MKRTKKNLTKKQIEVMNDGITDLMKIKSFKSFNDYMIDVANRRDWNLTPDEVKVKYPECYNSYKESYEEAMNDITVLYAYKMPKSTLTALEKAGWIKIIDYRKCKIINPEEWNDEK